MTLHISLLYFWCKKKTKKKEVGYYEINNIYSPCGLALAVNAKEYLELLEDRYLNKKNKGIKKGSSGFGFGNFTQRIKSLVNFDTFEKPPHDAKQLSQKKYSVNLAIKYFTFQIELSPYHFTTLV